VRDDVQKLLDILEAIERIEKYASKDRDSFNKDELIQSWIVRHLEIIGEACRSLSEEFKCDHPQVEWRAIIGMRNILTHRYFDIDLDVVWQAVEGDLPQLKTKIQSMLH